MKIKFKTSNAAFCNPITGEEDLFYCKQECVRILDKIRDKIAAGDVSGVIMDINGNKIGEWSL